MKDYGLAKHFLSRLLEDPHARLRRSPVWFRLVSQVWLLGYKLELIEPGRFRITQRLMPFHFECTIRV